MGWISVTVSVKRPYTAVANSWPTHGQRSRGRPATTYVDLLTKDTGLQTEELATAMTERCEWRDACFRDLRVTN